MQLSLFDIPKPNMSKNLEASARPSSVLKLEELFEAYFECRKNKRYTANALAFEIDYEHNLVHPVGHLSNGVKLCEEINNGTYQIGRSIAFIIDKPVKREIFAADFTPLD